MSNPDYATLFEFLQYPLETTKPVIERFASLPGAIARGSGEQSFVYMPGKRKDRVLLVAHADTVWDCDPNHTSSFAPSRFVERDGVIHSQNPSGMGLGADDRAGCAILWNFREYGHSLLVVSGEENGRIGSTFLMESNPDIADEINRTHGFMIELDRRNAQDYKCYDVGSTHFRAISRLLAEGLHRAGQELPHGHLHALPRCLRGQPQRRLPLRALGERDPRARGLGPHRRHALALDHPRRPAPVPPGEKALA